MKYGEISIDPEVMSGAPVFAGTRVQIQTLLDYIEGGEDLAEFLDDFPSVSKESALAVLEMAKKQHEIYNIKRFRGTIRDSFKYTNTALKDSAVTVG